MRVVFIHGACVEDGGWWWRPTGDLLAAENVGSHAAALPSCGESATAPDGTGPGLDADVAAVRDVLEASDEPTVLVVHSYGGIVAAEAAADVASVRHLVLVSSYLPEVGESLATFGGEEPAPFLAIDPEAGTFTVKTDALAEIFLQDCSDRIKDEATGKTASQSLAVPAQPVGAAAWRTIPSTYVVCTEDRGTPVELQRGFAEKADRVVELESGHHPFISQPAAVRDLILAL